MLIKIIPFIIICILILVILFCVLKIFLIEYSYKKEEKLDKYNGPENTIYLNVNDYSDMRCPYQLMTVKHDGFENGDQYMHVRLEDNEIKIDALDEIDRLNKTYMPTAPFAKDNLNNNTSYDFKTKSFSKGCTVNNHDQLYKEIVKDNQLEGKSYQAVYAYLKQKNDYLRLTSNEIDLFKSQFDKAKIEYDKYIENTKPVYNYDFTDQQRKLQVRDDLKDVLDKLN